MSSALGRAPRVLAVCGLAALVLKLILVGRYTVDSDEPQHLHIVWAWAHGLLPYRDVFDNHAPLFHLLMTPILGSVGERPDIVIWGRVVMLPLWLLALGLTYAIARAIDTAERARWCAILLAALPVFATRTTEFRTDDLWTVVWLAAVAVLVPRRSAAWRVFLTGALLGIALTVSMKTLLLLVALVLARALRPSVAGHLSPGPVSLRRVVLGVFGLLAPPALVAAYFWHRDALGPMWYGVIEHNVLPEDVRLVAVRLLWLAIAIAGVAALARSMAAADRDHGPARAWLMLVTGTYLALVVIAWPARTSQTFLPALPLVVILATSALGRWPAERRPSWARGVGVFVMLFAVEAAVTVVKARAWRNDVPQEVQFVAETLKLTSPDDEVFDFKGETIFRRRSYFLVFESITRARLKLGLMPDDVADRLVDTRTCVTVPVAMAGLERTAAFIHEHYLPVGRLLVVGRMLELRQGRAEFDVPFPAPYLVVGPAGPAAGSVDDLPNTVPRGLNAGRHAFVSASAVGGPLAVIWGPAAERGFSPFGTR